MTLRLNWAAFFIGLAALFFTLAEAHAMTRRECIHASPVSDNCHWSKATGGRVNGWTFTNGKTQAAGKSSKADARAAPSPSSTAMSAVSDAIASAFGGTDRQSSTPGSKRENAVARRSSNHRVDRGSPDLEHREAISLEAKPRPADTLAGAAKPVKTVLVHDTLTAADKAISETTGAVVQPDRWVSQYAEILRVRQRQQERAELLPTVPMPAALLPASKPVAAAAMTVLPRSLRPSTFWWDALILLIGIGSIAAVVGALALLVGEISKWWKIARGW